MANQTGKGLIIAFKVEATLNTAPGASSAEVLRLTASPGLKLSKALIQSQEIRPDGLTALARHGSRRVEGSYGGELSVGSFDTILEAVVRTTAVTAVAVTEATASLASITFGTNTVDATSTSAGSGFLEAGIRVGDVLRVTGTGGANDSLNAQVQAVATHTVTVGASSFTVDASAATSFVLTIGKKLKNATTPTRRSFYVDEYHQDIDLSEVFGGVRWTGFQLQGTPDGMAQLTLSALGMSATALATGTSPYYTTPTEYTSLPLVFADAVLTVGGVAVSVATGFSLNYQLTANTLPVIGSSITPDVFDNEARLDGSLTVLRQDLDELTNFINETELELTILLQEPGSAPKAYIGLFVPRLVLTDNDAQLGSDGGMVETIPWTAGVKASATGYDAGLLTITTSAT